MSRFPEQRRIEEAIKHKDVAELQWALSYARMRLKWSTMKHHEKHWRHIEKRVLEAMESVQNSK